MNAADVARDLGGVIDKNEDFMRSTFRMAYRVTGKELGERGLDENFMLALGSTRDAMLDDLMARASASFQEQHGKKVACSSGCAFCCYQHVYVSPSEAIYIALRVVENDRPAMRRAASEQAARIAGLGRGERFAKGIACGFLEKGRTCGIYEARPSACRTYASVSRFACMRDWERRNKRLREYDKNIPFLADPPALNQALQMGGDAVLHERGLQMVRMELGAAMARVLEPGVIAEWLAGGQPFAERAGPEAAPYAMVLASAKIRFGA